MNQSSTIISKVDEAAALAYLAKHTQDSRIVEYIGIDVLAIECQSITVVTTSQTPCEKHFTSPVNGEAGPCKEWLSQKVISYLQSNPNGAVLFEDPISSLSDPGLANSNHPPYWHYNDRIFWPVLPTGTDSLRVEQAQAWVAGFREIVCFVEVPSTLASLYKTKSLSDAEFSYIASSLKSIVTDVFDNKGYMEWQRKMSTSAGERK